MNRLAPAWSGQKSDSILWIASFPRSGNTFLRILLANYFASERVPYPINDLVDIIPADTSPSLWDFVPVPQAGGLVSRPTVQDHLPLREQAFAAYRRRPLASPLRAVKTHTGNFLHEGRPLLDLRAHDRIVYVVRNPLDVLVSYADYNNRDIDSALTVMTQSGAVATGETLREFEVRGSWRENVTSWVNDHPCPMMIVRYLELCEGTEAALTEILRFLGAPIDRERLTTAVAYANFSHLRSLEDKAPFIEAPHDTKSGRFFREGRSRQWLKALTPEQAYRLADDCGDIMQKLGFTHPRDVYFDGRNAYQAMTL